MKINKIKTLASVSLLTLGFYGNAQYSPTPTFQGKIGKTQADTNTQEAGVTSDMMKEFTMWELEAALAAADGHSACGPDRISNKDIKSLPENSKTELLKLFNDMWVCGQRYGSKEKASRC